MKTQYPFDVALSFAEEDRNVAAGINDCLSFLGVKTYYYPDHPEENWGNPLKTRLPELYEYEARIGLVLLSSSYTQKEYTRIEFNALNRRRRNNRGDFLLILRLDHTSSQELPNVPKDLTYLDWKYNPRKISELILKKLEQLGWQSEPSEKALEEPGSTGTQQMITGDRNIQIGGNVTAGGDQNF